MNDIVALERISQLQDRIIRLESERDHLSDCLAKALDHCASLRVIAAEKMACKVCEKRKEEG